MRQATQNTMKAIALDRFGGLETRKLQMLPVPEVGPDEVLIHVEWAGVGQWDPFEREGGFAKVFGIEPKFPYVLGSDGAGTVAAVGDRVKGLKPGDRVYAFSLVNPKGGFYAEYAAVKADDVSRIPGKLTTQQAGAMPVDAMTALRGLDDTLALKPGESVDDLRVPAAASATSPCSSPNAWAPVCSRSLRAATAWRWSRGWVPTRSSTDTRTTS